MDLPALIAFHILYTHVNDYRDFGGNEQNKCKREQRKPLIKLKINTRNL